MNKLRIVSLTLFVLFLFSLPVSAEQKEVLIKKSSGEINSLLSTSNQELESQLEVVTIEAEDYDRFLEELQNDSQIEYFEEEITFHYTNTPNDPLFKKQRKDFDLINVTQAWQQYSPQASTIVAVLDSGANTSHPDLKNKVYKSYNVITSSTNVRDDVGHGTHVAGIVGAETNNREGISSIARDVRLMPIKIGDEYGASNMNIVKGIQYAVKNNASIINISLGSYQHSQAVHDAIKEAVNKGIFVIAAAGNDGVQAEMYPAAYPEVLSVGAVDNKTDNLASFSNYGDWVSVTAPGVNIHSTCVKGNFEPYDSCSSSSSYMDLSGTSMAAPMTASLAAMLKNEAPNLTNKQNRYVIEQSSDQSNSNSKYYDFGRIDAAQAMDLLYNENRIAGSTSVATSAAIANYGWSKIAERELTPRESDLNKDVKQKKGRFAVLASNQSFPDSLAASALANELDAPILLTSPRKVDEQTIRTLKSYNVSDVVVLGGTVAIPDSIVKELEKEGLSVTRLRGPNRYSTAVELNNYIAEKNGEVIIANGRNFPDALAVSTYAAKLGIPIVFVEDDQIPAETAEFLAKYDFSQSYVVGGTAVVSSKVLNQLPNPKRISGPNRYETAIAINDYFESSIDGIDGYHIVTGQNFPDALAGGVFGARTNMPLVLVQSDRMPSKVEAYLQQQKDAYGHGLSFHVLGGKAAVSTDVKWQVDQIMYEEFYQNMGQNSYQTK
ncbi:S8 family serine peptidase [Halalkalibacter okhensis]|uniref:S8 family serine peptidase n=1 Tax=Halalkalibacter okhensis TaxID=333138 RepID=UPI00068CDD31|nr:cell wall-binding repeat-containing protein [Halalkalibacter okhensis]